MKKARLQDLLGGSPKKNASIARRLLRGKKDAYRDGVCFSVGVALVAADVEKLMAAVEADPTLEVECDIEAQQVRFGGDHIAAAVPAGVRQQLLEGSWDALGQLLDDPSAIGATAARLPYIRGFLSDTTIQNE